MGAKFWVLVVLANILIAAGFSTPGWLVFCTAIICATIEGRRGWTMDDAHALSRDTIEQLTADVEALREALEEITESRDAGRHDGLPEDCPAHDADTMFAIARRALKTSETQTSDAGETR
jgi:hypothetical protein